MGHGQVVADVEELVGRQLGGAQHVHRRLRVEGLLRAHNQRGMPLGLIGVRVCNLLHGRPASLRIPSGCEQRGELLVQAHHLPAFEEARAVTHQLADAIAFEHLLHLRSVVLGIHGPEGVDGATGSQHQPLCAARVHVQKVCDIVHAVLVCHLAQQDKGLVPSKGGMGATERGQSVEFLPGQCMNGAPAELTHTRLSLELCSAICSLEYSCSWPAAFCRAQALVSAVWSLVIAMSRMQSEPLQ